MKYYVLQMHPIYHSVSPVIIDWKDKFPLQMLRKQNAHLLPEKTILNILDRPETVFTGVLTDPFFLVRQDMRDIIEFADRSIMFKSVLLLNPRSVEGELYHLPILDTLSYVYLRQCTEENGEEGFEVSVESLDYTEKIIFQIESETGLHIVCRLDLLEKLLSVDMTHGIGLVPLTIDFM